MALKIDMAKAYDHVEWPLLETILKLHDFFSHFIDLIHYCVSTSSYSVLINESPYGHFRATRGIR